MTDEAAEAKGPILPPIHVPTSIRYGFLKVRHIPGSNAGDSGMMGCLRKHQLTTEDQVIKPIAGVGRIASPKSVKKL